MTTIKVTRNCNFFSLKIDGHTQPEVCAGISAIFQAVCGYAMNREESLIDLHMKIEAGASFISFYGDREALAVTEAAYIGLKQIMLGYPMDVKFIDDYLH